MSVLHELNPPDLPLMEEDNKEEESAVADPVFVDDDAPPPPSASGGAWELSKENVLPLRAGRRVKCLNEAVARDSLSQDAALREERHVFETELRGCALSGGGVGGAGAGASTDESTESSKDNLIQLLDIWHRYVNWTEQNYPSGKEINEILQRSLQAFPEATGDMARVADQPDYVDLWLKLANQREEPGDIFQFMYSKKIGRSCGTFYEQWAWHLEDVGNTKKASAVLAKGVVNIEVAANAASVVASPASSPSSVVTRLEKLKADLELRVARGIRTGIEDMRIENEENEGGPTRKTLGDLRGKGKHMTAPNMRVGPQATIPGMRRGISGGDNNAGSQSSSRVSSSSSASRRPAGSASSNTPSTSSSSSSGFQIFSDDHHYHDVVSDNKFAANPVDATAKSKENTQKPSQWNKVKVKQKVSSIPTTPLTPSFDIHVDDVLDAVGDGAGCSEAAADGVFKTPAKTINMTHARPLSTKKVEKAQMKPLDFLEKIDDGKTEEKFMFCKDKVYQGLEEFSFEEIRFEMWKLKR